ncbi:DNA-binding transcriptional regulator [Novosphingobium sp. TCA1]|uniref:helix-turn-helix domain-containing protein n=1 Tax=Novosphingobium sp. TCA1 TaxID=2682474 RepID=UPI00130C8014|nr:XRE family transcriptional regulator [Novosphingobium sp. TCA1]GFE72355.1 hypothetical protein NTCA1_00040 [Novosphingobium sp. TCA1]
MDDEDFAGLVDGLQEAVTDIKSRQAAYVKDVRAKTQLSQAAFARRYHLNVRTLQNWEGGKPVDKVGQVLLRLIERDPVAVDRMLNT